MSTLETLLADATARDVARAALQATGATSTDGSGPSFLFLGIVAMIAVGLTIARSIRSE